MPDDDIPATHTTLRAAGPKTYILALARSFPCLRGKVGHLTPETWDVDAFIRASGPWSHGEKVCALFVACVWNPGYAEEQGWRFDAIDFVSIADNLNRRALLAWLENPVWP